MMDRKISNRMVGGLLIALALAVSYLLVSFLNMLNELSQSSCTCGDTCNMVHYDTPATFYLGFIAVFILLFIGIYIFAKKEPATTSDRKEKWSEKLSTLDADEKVVFTLLMESDGTLFQSEIVEKTGLSKVKVTRILDKLESRMMVERRRRGLTNIVVIKD
ncbi:MAG: hypothetical protein ABIH11_06760 [Candidatus Altiarchaeota archaeon]